MLWLAAWQSDPIVKALEKNMSSNLFSLEFFGFLRDAVVAGIVKREGDTKHALAIEVAEEVCDELVFEWGGNQVYIPRGLLARMADRNQQIIAEFNGKNYRELAKKHNRSEMRIRQILQAIMAMKPSKEPQ